MLDINDCKLRIMEERDLEIVLKWRNDERIRATMFNDHIISFEEHSNWFKRVKKNIDVEKDIYLIFEYKSFPLGQSNYTGIDKKNGNCFGASYIGEDGVLIGAGAVMNFLCMEYLFKIKNIRKLSIEIFAFNKLVISSQKKLGFVQEGYFPRHILKNNSYEDVVRLALFQDVWLKNKPKIETLIFRSKKVDFDTLRKILPNT